MRVVYLNCLQAPPDLTGEAVLAAWPTLAEVPAALSRAALEVDVVVAAGAEAMLRRDGVTYWFAPGGPGGVAEAVANCRPDVVHQQSFHFGRHTRALHERLESERPVGEMLAEMFYRGVAEKRGHFPTIDDDYRATQLVLEARRSHREGRRLAVSIKL